jgi:hypothetical protein
MVLVLFVAFGTSQWILRFCYVHAGFIGIADDDTRPDRGRGAPAHVQCRSRRQ